MSVSNIPKNTYLAVRLFSSKMPPFDSLGHPRPSSGWARLLVAMSTLALVGSAPRPVQVPPHRAVLAVYPEQVPLVKNPSFEIGDIVVKPNLDWLPGSSGVGVPFNFGFGHAVLIVSDSPKAGTLYEKMQQTEIFEAQSRDVPRQWQVRANYLWNPSDDTCTLNDSYARGFEGYRFRLRLPLSKKQKLALLAFAKAQDADYFSWRSLKKQPLPNGDSANQSWYCSLLVWYSFYKTLGLDLDANQGWYVYPNDLINSPYFQNSPTDSTRLVRF